MATRRRVRPSTIVAEDRYPTLGPIVERWILENCVHGPGDILGAEPVLRGEVRRFLWRCYELYPKGHPLEGKRRFQWAVFSRIKGTAKSEVVAWLVLLELYGPCRFGGWDRAGRPMGRRVVNPYIPVAATGEEQADDTLWGAVHAIATHGPLASRLDIGVDRIIEPDTVGEAKLVTSSSIARDGGKPTFTAVDETHLWVAPELVKLANTMRRNLAKRAIADPWGAAATTMFAAGERSVAERDWDLAQAGTPWLLYDHREAGPDHDTTTDDGLRAAILDAAGDATFIDADRIARDYRRDPKEGERYWLNRRKAAAQKVIDPEVWNARAVPGAELVEGDLITLGFDGSVGDDSTALIATRIDDGLQIPLGVWERPPELHDSEVWEVPRAEVSAAIATAFELYRVLRVYADPPYWTDELSSWRSEYGDRVVLPFWTNRDKAMGYAVHRWHTAITVDRALTHAADPVLDAHVRNSCRRLTRVRLVAENADDDGSSSVTRGRFLFVITKDRAHSPRKVDAAVAAVLSWEARADAIAAGLHKEAAKSKVVRFL